MRRSQWRRPFRSAASAQARLASVVLSVALVACVKDHNALSKKAPDSVGKDIAQLWVEPKDLESRDLFLGPGGRESVPAPSGKYRVVGYDTTGHSRGYEVEDAEGRRWKIKIGEEAQSEIVVSRVLWAIGFHQPVMHYVKRWHLTGGKPDDKAAPASFRLDSDHKILGFWRWDKDNPFYGSRPYRGLIVANLLMNNWDFGPDQNRIYQMKVDSDPKIRFIVQDVGGSLGKTRWPWGTRNNVDDFEGQGFVRRVSGNIVTFDYTARHRILIRDITVENVAWTCRLLSRLSDAQLRDAFRAADYTPEVTDRYMKKIRDKIRQGLSLRADEKA